MNPLRIAHRYLADGSIEVICMNCLDVVCNVKVEGDATPFRDTHACGSTVLSNRDRRRLRLLVGLRRPVSREVDVGN